MQVHLVAAGDAKCEQQVGGAIYAFIELRVAELDDVAGQIIEDDERAVGGSVGSMF